MIFQFAGCHFFINWMTLLSPSYHHPMLLGPRNSTAVQTPVSSCLIHEGSVDPSNYINKQHISDLVGGLEPWNFITFHILGMSSSQLTFIFFRGVGQPPTSDGISTEVMNQQWQIFLMIYQLYFIEAINQQTAPRCKSSPTFIPSQAHGW